MKMKRKKSVIREKACQSSTSNSSTTTNVWWSEAKPVEPENPLLYYCFFSLFFLVLARFAMSMSMVHPSVHPIEAPPMTDHAIAIPRHTLKDTQGMPGTLGGFLLRFLQFSFAVVSLSVMATTSDFPSVTAFR